MRDDSYTGIMIDRHILVYKTRKVNKEQGPFLLLDKQYRSNSGRYGVRTITPGSEKVFEHQVAIYALTLVHSAKNAECFTSHNKNRVV